MKKKPSCYIPGSSAKKTEISQHYNIGEPSCTPFGGSTLLGRICLRSRSPFRWVAFLAVITSYQVKN